MPCLKARLSPFSLIDVIHTLGPFEFYLYTHLTLGYTVIFHFSLPLLTLSTDSADAEVGKNRACIYGMYNAYTQLKSVVEYL